MNRTQNSSFNLFASIFTQIIQIVLKFVTRTIFIRTLGNAFLGVNGLFTDILTLLSITELGFDTAINFKLYKPLSDKDYHRLSALMKFYRNVYAVVSISVLVLGLSITPFLRFLISDYDLLAELGLNAILIYFLYLIQSVLSYLFWAYRASLVRAAQKSFILDGVNVGTVILSNVCQIVVLLLFKNFYLYLLILVFFTIATNVINSVIAKKMFPLVFCKETEKNVISSQESKEIFKDCGATFLYKVNGVVTRATDNLVISSFIGIVTVGLYSNYTMISTTINTVLNKFFEACKASMGDAYANLDKEKSYFYFEVMNFLTAILYGTAFLGMAIVGNAFIKVWLGQDYQLKPIIPVLLGIVLFFNGIKNNLGQIRNISGAFRQMWFRPLLGILINLVVSIVLVQFIGIVGVLIGTIAAAVLTNFLVDPIVIHKYSYSGIYGAWRYYRTNFIYMLLLCGLYFLFSFGIRSMPISNDWVVLIIRFLCCAVLTPLVFLLVFWNKKECCYLRQKAKDLFFVLKKRIRR